jgi:hypothetical protein
MTLSLTVQNTAGGIFIKQKPKDRIWSGLSRLGGNIQLPVGHCPHPSNRYPIAQDFTLSKSAVNESDLAWSHKFAEIGFLDSGLMFPFFSSTCFRLIFSQA